MKQWVVLSGKGGTGKTTVAAALAHLAAQELHLVLADADVDAANLELLTAPQVQEAHPFSGARVAAIDAGRCTGCDLCADACRFSAIVREGGYRVDALACEGCAACMYVCPAQAIAMVDRPSGEWFRSDTRFGPLFHARLFAGQENSGKLVTQVKQSARLAAHQDGADLLLVDGPPGIGCPAIAAMSGADLALMVVEPSVSSVHDLRRILATARHFGVQAAICLNKADLNPAQAAAIAHTGAAEGVPVIGRIPFDQGVVEALVQRRPVTEQGHGAAREALRGLWKTLRTSVP